MTYSKGSSTPWATTTNLRNVCQHWESVLVAQWDKDHSVMDESAHRGDGSRFLAASGSTGRDEHAYILAIELALGPDTAGLVPECLPLRREVSITGWDAEQDSIVREQIPGLSNWVF